MRTLILMLAAVLASAEPAASIFDPPPPGQFCQQHWVQICGEHGCRPVVVCD